MKSMRDMINLMEGVEAVPGVGKIDEKSSSEKQARFMAAAAHDPKFAKKVGMDQSVAKEFNKADTGTEQLSKAMKHKEEECSMTTMEDIPATPNVASCNQDNPEDARTACAMEEDFEGGHLEADAGFKRFEDLVMNSYVEPEHAYEMVVRDMSPEVAKKFDHMLEQHGFAQADAAEQEFATDMAAMDKEEHPLNRFAANESGPGMEEDYNEEGKIPMVVKNGIRIHDLTGLDGEEAYDITQTYDGIKDGDLMLVDGGVAVMNKAWPVMMVGQFPEFHQLNHGASWDRIDGGKYNKSFEVAQSLSGGIAEDFDLNNGYDDINDANGTDYFPTGGDSPVVTGVGGNARSGDNPEQKRVAVAEVHKELVYKYREYLNESAQKKS